MDVSRTVTDTNDLVDRSVTNIKLGDANIVESAGCGNFTTTSATYVDVTNLSVTITTTGRPVLVCLTSDGSGDSILGGDGGGATNSNMYVRIWRDGDVSFQGNIANFTTNYNYSTPNIHHLESVAAGTYTYKVSIRHTTGGTALCYKMKLKVMEL